MFNLSSILKNSNGQFIGVTFVKQDGTVRNMNCRLGVKRHLKLTDAVSDFVQSDKQKEYITVYDIQKKGYRSIHKDRILSVRIGGATIRINNPNPAFDAVSK